MLKETIRICASHDSKDSKQQPEEGFHSWSIGQRALLAAAPQPTLVLIPPALYTAVAASIRQALRAHRLEA
jgi:hypothetical protein